ncbi:hypothetical protein FHG87_001481 [Trinorchestia longiramus]|nr:hypothetical protein FHG87_001481 [Trinorchestia longiramus]
MLLNSKLRAPLLLLLAGALAVSLTTADDSARDAPESVNVREHEDDSPVPNLRQRGNGLRGHGPRPLRGNASNLSRRRGAANTPNLNPLLGHRRPRRMSTRHLLASHRSG